MKDVAYDLRMDPWRDAVTVVGLLSLFGVAELARERGVPVTTTRSAVHTVGAGITATFPLYLGLEDIVLLGVVFTAFLAGTWARGLVGSVHAVPRPTVGALLFPAGLALTALLTWPHSAAFGYAALVLALADPAASHAGCTVRSPRWRVAGGTKTLAGSAVFFAVTLALGLAFTMRSQAIDGVPAVVAASLLLTAIEGCLGYGLDNLPVPVVAGLLGEHALGL